MARLDRPRNAFFTAILTRFSPRRRHFLLVGATALLWWLAGAFGLFFLGWVALAPFFWLLDDLPARARFRWGYFCGFCSFFLINWWLLPTITRGAPAIGAPLFLGAILSVVAVSLIALIHGAGTALVALLWNRKIAVFARFPFLLPVAAAVLWAILDWLRCWGPISHSWGALAFSQVADKPLLQSAAWIGQHGLSALCVWFAASLILSFLSGRRVFAVAAALIFSVLHLVGCLSYLAPRGSQGPVLNVLVVQTDVASLQKRGRGSGEGPLTQAFRLTETAGPLQSSLVVWPETTINFQKSPAGYGGLEWEQWRGFGPKTTLLTGAQTFDADGRRFNEAVLISRGKKVQSSAKGRLVPFGERAPFVDFLPFLGIFAPRPALEPGAAPQILKFGDFKIGTLICFESCFPNPARDLKRQGAQILVVLTNDEWFEGTEAPRQHAAMAAMRAVENGVFVVQAANGGYSFVVDPQGRFVVSTPYGTSQTFAASVPLAP